MTYKTYVGNCVNSFDDDGDCVVPSLPYRHTSDFASGEEDAHTISKSNFEKCVSVPDYLHKTHNHKDTIHLHDKENDVYMMYEPKKDIHYFFTN